MPTSSSTPPTRTPSTTRPHGTGLMSGLPERLGPSACPSPACSPFPACHQPAHILTSRRGSGCVAAYRGLAVPASRLDPRTGSAASAGAQRDRPGMPAGREPRAGCASGCARPRARPHRRLHGYRFRQVPRRHMAQPRLSHGLRTTSPTRHAESWPERATHKQPRSGSGGVQYVANTDKTAFPGTRRHGC